VPRLTTSPAICTCSGNAAARDLDQDTLDRSRRLFGDDHSHTLALANNLAGDLHMLGQYAAARDMHLHQRGPIVGAPGRRTGQPSAVW
jgi:hypothetical protein